MTPSQIFGIVVRAFGLSLLVYAIWNLVYGVATALGFPEQQRGFRIAYFLDAITFILIAIYLLRGATHIVRFSYPEESKPMNNTKQVTGVNDGQPAVPSAGPLRREKPAGEGTR